MTNSLLIPTPRFLLQLPADESQLEEEEMEAVEEDMHNDYGLAQLIK